MKGDTNTLALEGDVKDVTFSKDRSNRGVSKVRVSEDPSYGGGVSERTDPPSEY